MNIYPSRNRTTGVVHVYLRITENWWVS